MSTSNENQETEVAIPPFLDRWLLLFRRYPQYLWNVRFLFDVIIKRKPIFWNNLVKSEQKFRKEHPHCTFGRHTEECIKQMRAKIEEEREQMRAKIEEDRKQMRVKPPLGWRDESWQEPEIDCPKNAGS
jgi:hypothetical protein